MKQTELLAPAGSEAALYAAVQSGADAVYVGGSRFSARASANNFDEAAMQKAVEYCHLRGVKLYVTQNTLIKQSELAQAVEYAAFLYEIGVDGLIVQDLGLARAVHAAIPDFPLHASTQMTVHNLEGVRALERLGFVRVVLARELSKAQIAHIAKHCTAELEIFVHGALCFCYSGQCLLSSVLGGRSGNRGRCAQPCRLPYSLTSPEGKTVKSGYLMSPKDLALIDDLGTLAELGIASLKIEGRLKKPAYVATVTEVYKKRLLAGGRATKQEIQSLLDAFNRSGFTDGYFQKRLGADMMSTENPSNVSPERFAEGIELRGNENANLRLLDVQMLCMLKPGSPAELTVTDAEGNSVTVYGDVVQAAQNRPTEAEEICARLAKTGGTPYSCASADAKIYGDVFMPVSAVNALRRNALDALSAMRLHNDRTPVQLPDDFSVRRASRTKTMELCVSAETIEQAKAALAYKPAYLYAPRSVIDALATVEGCTLVTKLPEICVQENRERIFASLQAKHLLVSGIGEIVPAQAKIHTDFRIGVYNVQTANELLDMGAERLTVSPELNLDEIAQLGDAVLEKASVLAYGRMPLMVMQNCLMRAYTGKCQKGKGVFTLTDRRRTVFPVLCRPEACVNVLLNSKPTYMADKLGDLAAAGVRSIRLDFTVETAHETARVLEAYVQAIDGGKVCPPEENTFTRGHFYRGVQ